MDTDESQFLATGERLSLITERCNYFPSAYCIFLDANFNGGVTDIICEPQIKPTLESQAIGRAHRMGQVRTVHVHRLVIPEGIDKQMMDMLDSKRIAFDGYARYSHLAQTAEGASDGN